MEKEVSKMTLCEFLEIANQEDSNNILNDQNFGMLKILTNEGFSKPEALQMNMTKVWDLFRFSLTNSTTPLLTELFRMLEKKSENPLLNQPKKDKVDQDLEIQT